MSRTIVSISVPIGSVAYDIINKWRNNDRNISDLICKAVGSSGTEQAHIEGCKKRIRYLEELVADYEGACERAGVRLKESTDGNKRANPSPRGFYARFLNDEGRVLSHGKFS
jgi:hypothetical protein